MKTPANIRRSTTVRLAPSTREMLERASYHLKRTHNQIIEDALIEYAKNHDFFDQYQAIVTKSQVVLMQVGDGEPEVLKVTERNGVSLAALTRKLSVQVGAPVRLVLAEK